MELLTTLAGVVTYVILGWLILLISMVVLGEGWIEALCDYHGDFDAPLVAFAILCWPVFCVILPIVVFGKCIAWSLRIVKRMHFSKGE